jgi:hypothetical protein
MLWFSVVATAIAVAAFGYGCGQTTAGTCADNGTCAPDSGLLDATGDVFIATDAPTSGDDGGTAMPDTGASSGGGDGGPSGCDTTLDPSATPCLVDSQYGVFVSVSGSDSAAGTKADPLKTITSGIAKAALGARRVFVCAGTYDEHLVVSASQGGIGVYGGFDCTSWGYAATKAAKVQPSTVGYALEVDSLTVGATFEDLEFDAKDATAPGASSIAVFANQSIVNFHRVTMSAGNGAAGAGGDAGSNYVGTQASIGNDAVGTDGGAQVVCTCVNGDQTTGGTGGTVGPPAIGGSPGAPALGGGAGGVSGTGGCTTVTTGAGSQDAPIGVGAASYGLLSAQGWTVTAGAAGSTASVAQGGGGGGSNPGTPGHGGGGSGGCGGCGGAGGSAGIGGGSSIALLSYQSTIVVTSATLQAANASNGGSGGPGQTGQSAGYGGLQSQPGCTGGSGGNGGGGSGGGGGAGGLSLAVGYVGTAPMQTSTVTKVGNAGTGGAGGMGGGANNAGGKGKDGVAMPTLAL